MHERLHNITQLLRVDGFVVDLRIKPLEFEGKVVEHNL